LLKKPNPELHVPVKESSRKQQVTIIAPPEFAENIRKLNDAKQKGKRKEPPKSHA
jgi:hypothetical protein